MDVTLKKTKVPDGRVDNSLIEKLPFRADILNNYDESSYVFDNKMFAKCEDYFLLVGDNRAFFP